MQKRAAQAGAMFVRQGCVIAFVQKPICECSLSRKQQFLQRASDCACLQLCGSRKRFLRKKVKKVVAAVPLSTPFYLNAAPELRLKPESVAELRSFVAAAPETAADRASFVGEHDVVCVFAAVLFQSPVFAP